MRGSRSVALSTITLTGAAILLAGCSGAGGDALSTSSNSTDDSGALSSTGDASAGGDQLADLQSSDSVADAATAQGRAPASGSGLLSEVPSERAVIATAEMTLRSDDVMNTIDAIESIAESAGGFLSGRDISSNPDDPKGTRALVILRVPTAKLDSVIDNAAAEGEVVRVTADEKDVTETVVDVDSRVESARASVVRIRALLSQATTIGEVVRIESELARREADLESLLAQQRSLADQTALATISITVLSPDAVEPVAQEDEEGFVAGLEQGWEALVGVVVVALTTLGLVLPFLLVGALILGPLAAAWRRRRPAVEARAAEGDAPHEREREPEPVH